jgi:RNA polymerase sigma factor (sigma-70 family)
MTVLATIETQAVRHDRRRSGKVSVTQAEAVLDEEGLSGLIGRIAGERDKAAFAALFRHFAPRIKGFGLKSDRDAALAEELVQETMLAVWRSAHTYDPARASATTWIFTICRNRRIDLYRRRSRPEADPPADDDWVVGPTQELETEITATFRRTREYMNELPPEQAEVLRMSFLEDKSHGEIAAATGYPLGTVKSRIRLALASLRRRMEQ